MGTFQGDDTLMAELDDSGVVHDASPHAVKTVNMSRAVEILDLSDEVLLCIFKYCSPQDLKALAYTCVRLASLSVSRALWTRADARAAGVGRARLRWMLAHALHEGTVQLMLSGYAKEAKRCMGHVRQSRADLQPDAVKKPASSSSKEEANDNEKTPVDVFKQHARMCFNATLPRFSNSPLWLDEFVGNEPANPYVDCPGPQFTVSPWAMKTLKTTCPNLTELALEYCNINCVLTNLSQFPQTLEKLSLKGTKCFNLPIDKSFLFRVHDYLPNLLHLNLSQCEWLDPASFLPISKLKSLETMEAQDCYKLSEFVAYASLAARYGLRKLKTLDLRGSPVGDSEVSAFGWLPCLECLYLSPSQFTDTRMEQHCHYKCDALPQFQELQPWEKQEHEFFKTPNHPEESATPDFGSLSCCPCRETSRANANDMFMNAAANMEHTRVITHGPASVIIGGFRPPQELIDHHTEQIRRVFGRDIRVPREIGVNGEEENDGNEEGADRLLKRNRPDEDQSKDKPTKSKDEDLMKEDGDDVETSDSDSDDESGNAKKRKIVVCFKRISPQVTISSMNTSNGESSSAEKSVNSDKPVQSGSKTDQGDRNSVNEGAGTSKSSDNSSPSNSTSTRQNSEEKPKEASRYIRFQNNRPPVLVCPGEERREAPPRAHMVFVDPVQQFCGMYQLVGPFSFARRDLISNESLVTDSTVMHFGRADADVVNYIQIGPNIAGEHGARPERSNLRELSIRGFRNITDRSLEHLATAAPNLRVVDFTGTGVTAQGVEKFTNQRPDCIVKFKKLDTVDSL